MAKGNFDEQLDKVRKITEVVNSFKSEQVQLLAFKMLLNNSESDGVEDGNINLENNNSGLKTKLNQKKTTVKKSSKKSGNTKKVKPTQLSMVKDLNLKPKDKESIDDFMTKKSPRSSKEKATACVYYLRQILNITNISYSHVFTCFKHLQWRLPANLPNMMQQAGTQGWLDTSGNTDIKVTTLGENLIEHDLPKKGKQ